ncbi:MAG: FG-GAP repeat protein [Proteobacteria bacterium]|nr:FG-GAP repeat protein [Pseudomonadota bacterium]
MTRLNRSAWTLTVLLSTFAAPTGTARACDEAAESLFVEPVCVIREWRGEAPEDQFGWIARNIGDVDGDGIADVVASAPTHGSNGSNAGRIYVYSTGRNKLLWSADGRLGDQLGSGVEGVGDTDGDGVPDVAASGPDGGIAHIYSGRDGRILHSFRAPRKDELFGNHVAGAGDFDGDGFADIIIGSPGKPGTKRNPGHAYIYSGKSGSLLLTLSGENPGDEFGSTVAGYARDGVRFLVVGAPKAGKSHHGRAYVYRNGVADPSFTIEADETGNALGAMFVAVLGDVDGDGIADIYASDWRNEAKGPSTGRVYIYSGRTGQHLYTLTGEGRGDGFGTSPSVAGDIDRDGHSDLIVGAWQYGKVVVGGGRAYLYGGANGDLLKTFTSRVPGETFGFDAVGLGDVDHDGVDDLLITSGWSGVNGHHSGRVFVISSGIGHAPAR